MYEYRATIVRVIDGDTVVADIDLGLRVWARGQMIRLAGINAPEMTGESKEDGEHAKEFLELVILNKTLVVRTQKDQTEKYGRWLGTIVLPEGDTVNQLMIEAGHAVRMR